MMKVAVFVLALGIAPVSGAECSTYVSAFDVGSIQFNGDGKATYSPSSGDGPFVCGYSIGDETGNDLSCDNGMNTQFSFSSATHSGADPEELLVLNDHVWYRRCE